MREILFRGKRKVCDEWVYGFPFISRKGEYKIKWYDGYYGSSKTSEVYPESVGQFTGLTDKNGKKIFEGDVITIQNDTPFEMTGHIVFDGGCFELHDPTCDMYECLWYEAKDMEVLGNIHDNPELLENP